MTKFYNPPISLPDEIYYSFYTEKFNYTLQPFWNDLIELLPKSTITKTFIQAITDVFLTKFDQNMIASHNAMWKEISNKGIFNSSGSVIWN